MVSYRFCWYSCWYHGSTWIDTNNGQTTDLAIKQFTPKEKQYSVSDRGGLSLLVKPNNTKAWRYNYRYGGKQKTLKWIGGSEPHPAASGEQPNLQLNQKKVPVRSTPPLRMIMI
ncbi:MAG: Arm DNA-binding domain-containing protein [Cellvibrionaceae bacterium]